MSEPLPVRADLEWLKKHSKQRLDTLRVENPGAKLSEAQLDVAREFGFPSWRKLKAHVERVRAELESLLPADARSSAASEVVAADNADLAALRGAIAAGETQAVADLLAPGPHWRGLTGSMVKRRSTWQRSATTRKLQPC